MSTPQIIERQCILVLQLVTPLHIGSGEPDGGADAGVVRDFNGLPGIPGTSIQGMVRAAVEAATDKTTADRIFGHSSTANRGTGRGGRLSVSWGVVHDSHNQPADKRLTITCRDSDPVRRDAARPMLRDHVCLNERGVADGRGKFDELVVSAGHRFTVHLRFVTASSEAHRDSDWHILEKVLRAGTLRLGGKTRRGLGAFEVVEWRETTDHSQQGLQDKSTETGSVALPALEPRTLSLTPETLWMFGGGTSENADSAPVSGTRIVWDDTGKGSVEPVWIIPGSAVKGAVAHRVRFHANRIRGNFIGQPQQQTGIEPWMIELFGTDQGEGKPGKVFIDDVFVAKEQRHVAPVQNHVAINPFTGGAKDSALFNDEPLTPQVPSPPLSVRIASELQGTKALEAFEAALADLAAGRLALGAHVGRGYGIFTRKGTDTNQQAA